VISLVFPTCCGACGRRGESPCARCAAALVRPDSITPPPEVDALYALFSYEGVGRELVTGLKYQNNRAAVRRLAAALAVLIDPSRFDAITWPPTVPDRRRRRGFDQAELLARRLARVARLPVHPLLRRASGPSQTGRSWSERWAGPTFTDLGWSPARVLVVDDVCTTGATLAAAARALRNAGAHTVTCVVVAQTPLKVVVSTADTADDAS
jgi:ComF family protein